MDGSYAPGRRGPLVVVVGGGASGTLTATHLLHVAAQAQAPLRVVLVDRHGRHGLGQAYATQHPAHLLNAPARQMSAVAGDPGHLVRWTGATDSNGDGFLRRSDYGRYLSETLAAAERRAYPVARVTRLTGDVVGIGRTAPGRPVRLHLAGQGLLEADYVVLATGNPPPVPPCPIPNGPRFILDPWEPGALEKVTDGSPVVILGTGLTMNDAALVVTDANPCCNVYSVSRHGLLPQVHRPMVASISGWLPATLAMSNSTQVRLSDLMWQVRSAVAARPAGMWHEVVDTLRPHVPRLWQRLSPADKRLFLRHVAPYWEVHRHRMPPATAQRVTALRMTGRLNVERGRVTSVTDAPCGVRVRIDTDGTSREIAAGWLINCTGPGRDITRTADPLLRGLFASGQARPDPLRLGLDADSHGALLDAAGWPSPTLFTLGPPLRGSRYETTAIPEIRDQAAALAEHLVAAPVHAAHARPGHAA
ncbi:MAG TPA: FAD/NAD(P)-binding protein [Streptosporangiaceae bacterium]|nr:FAD/NAD(P)-binding protein [Streptosporangiaceae bacterium]